MRSWKVDIGKRGWRVSDSPLRRIAAKKKGARCQPLLAGLGNLDPEAVLRPSCVPPINGQDITGTDNYYTWIKQPLKKRVPSLRVGIKSCLPFISYVRRLCRVVIIPRSSHHSCFLRFVHGQPVLPRYNKPFSRDYQNKYTNKIEIACLFPPIFWKIFVNLFLKYTHNAINISNFIAS